MPKFRVYAPVTGLRYFGEYDAASAADAVALAIDEHGIQVTLCHQCTDHVELDEIDETAAVAEPVEPVQTRKAKRRAKGGGHG